MSAKRQPVTKKDVETRKGPWSGPTRKLPNGKKVRTT